MDTMLSEIEKRQFQPGMQSIIVLLNRIKESWERDYAWISICIRVASDIEYYLSEDVLHVIFDNLILNSIQQNEKSNHLNIMPLYIQRLKHAWHCKFAVRILLVGMQSQSL